MNVFPGCAPAPTAWQGRIAEIQTSHQVPVATIRQKQGMGTSAATTMQSTWLYRPKVRLAWDPDNAFLLSGGTRQWIWAPVRKALWKVISRKGNAR